jgi:WD40 repeat protein
MLVGHVGSVLSVAVLPDGLRGLSGSDNGTLRVWDLSTGAELRRLGASARRVLSVAASSDGRRALAGSDEETARVWDLQTGAELCRFKGHTDWVWSVMALPDGQRALSSSKDYSTRLWDVETGAELCRFEGHTGLVQPIATLPNGRRALSRSDYSTLAFGTLKPASSCAGLRPMGLQSVLSQRFRTDAARSQALTTGPCVYGIWRQAVNCAVSGTIVEKSFQ